MAAATGKSSGGSTSAGAKVSASPTKRSTSYPQADNDEYRSAQSIYQHCTRAILTLETWLEHGFKPSPGHYAEEPYTHYDAMNAQLTKDAYQLKEDMQQYVTAMKLRASDNTAGYDMDRSGYESLNTSITSINTRVQFLREYPTYIDTF